MGEEAKIRIRAIRKEGMDTAKKLRHDNLLTEDGQKDFEVDVQELTDKHIKKIDEHLAAKEKEVMTV
jgi:ribosome recycling factor